MSSFDPIDELDNNIANQTVIHNALTYKDISREALNTDWAPLDA